MRRGSLRQLAELDPGSGEANDPMFDGMWDLDILNSSRTPFKWEHLVALVIVILSLVAGRWMYDGFFRLLRRDSETPFELANQLTKRDNKALCISFASFVLGLGIITTGSLSGTSVSDGFGMYVLTFIVYQVLGIVLMVFARFLIDKIVLRKINTAKGIVEDMNISVACVEGAAVISCTVLISTSASGDGPSLNLGMDLGATILYFILGQVLLIGQLLAIDAASKYFQTYTEQHTTPLQEGGERPPARPTFSKEISSVDEESSPNVAAGLSYGLEMVVTALIIAIPIRVGYSLLAAVIWVSIMLLAVMPLVHVFADKLVLRTASAADNILVHQNWGASIVIGVIKFSFALVANGVYQQNCSIAAGASPYSECNQKDLPAAAAAEVAAPLGDRLVHAAVPDIFKFQSLVDVVVLLFLVLGAKFMLSLRMTLRQGVGNARREVMSSFSLDAYLVSRSNNAVAISLAGYIIAVAMALTGVIDCPDANVGMHGLWVIVYTSFGMVLLFCAQQINHHVLLRTIDNSEELLKDNIAVACMEAGSLIACGRIMQAVLSGSSDSVEEGFATILLYWVSGQLILLLFSVCYRMITSFNDEAQIKAGNVAVGLSSGLTLVAVSFVITSPIMKYASYFIFLLVSFVGLALLILLRVVVDRAVLPGDTLDGEMQQRNWGAALIEGAAAFSIAIVLDIFQYAPDDNTC